jgi:hypothetical protein
MSFVSLLRLRKNAFLAAPLHKLNGRINFNDELQREGVYLMVKHCPKTKEKDLRKKYEKP